MQPTKGTEVSNDQSNYSSATLSWSHNTSAADNGVLYVWIDVDDGVAVNGATFHSVAMTELANVTWDGGNKRAALFRLANPDKGNYTVQITFASAPGADLIYHSVLFNGVDQALLEEDLVDNGTTLSVNLVTTSANCYLYDWVSTDSNNASSEGSNQTKTFDHAPNAGFEAAGSYYDQSTATPNTFAMAWTNANANAIVHFAIALPPVQTAEDERAAELTGQDSANSARTAETTGVAPVVLTAEQVVADIHLEWTFDNT